MSSFDLGPYLVDHHAVLRHVLGMKPAGVALEFGVGAGDSLRVIAARMPVVGFDSFAGLPQDWRVGYPQGMFACKPPKPPRRARIVQGLFEDTLPGFEFPDRVGLVHVDCDLYSSTATVLKYVGPHLRPGTFVVFDEWHGFEGCEDYEQRAWREYADDTGIGWEVIGHGVQQWAIRMVGS